MVKVIYFSREGENLVNGQINIINQGNTKQLAKIIASQLNCDMVEIKPVKDYPISYLETIDIVEKELRENSKPAYYSVKNPLYGNHLFIGFPTWCGSMPRIMKHFLEQENVSKKIIYPFCTHEGSGFGRSLYELNKVCPLSSVMPGLAIQGSRVNTSQKSVSNWLVHYKHYSRRN